VTEEEEIILWEKNVLGCQTDKSLVNTIYFYNGKMFGLRANEHRNLRFSNIKVESNCILYDGKIYLKHIMVVSKTFVIRDCVSNNCTVNLVTTKPHNLFI